METREWKTIKEYQDILFDFYNGIAKITINRPRYRNAFTPTTTSEISDALYYCRECQDINVVVLTGAGATFPYGIDPKDSNIRIAPSYPTQEEMASATDLFVLCVKLVSVEKLLEA